MKGYEVYCYCRGLIGWTKPNIETYLESKEKEFFEMICDYFIQDKHLKTEDIHNFLKANYHNNPTLFDPYKLLSHEAWEVYIDWKTNKSTPELFFQQVRKSFDFITNFCINKNISFDEYVRTFGVKHVREKKVDWTVAVHLQLVDRQKINKVEKLLLKNFLKEYSIIESRLYNQELKQLLAVLTHDMKRLLEEMKKVSIAIKK